MLEEKINENTCKLQFSFNVNSWFPGINDVVLKIV